jgi:hypothetical protein
MSSSNSKTNPIQTLLNYLLIDCKYKAINCTNKKTKGFVLLNKIEDMSKVGHLLTSIQKIEPNFKILEGEPQYKHGKMQDPVTFIGVCDDKTLDTAECEALFDLG